MRYVCKSLGWWQTGVLVLELKSEPSSQDMAEFWRPGITGHPPAYLTVPLPADVQLLSELLREDAFERFMQKLTPLLTRLGMELEQKEQIFTALTSLVESVQSSLSTPGYPLFTTVMITE